MRCGATVSQLEPAFYGIPSVVPTLAQVIGKILILLELQDEGIRKLLFLFEVRLLIVVIVMLLFCVEVGLLFQLVQEKEVA